METSPSRLGDVGRSAIEVTRSTRMRIRRKTDVPISFNIRELFVLVTLSAIAMWWGAIDALIAVFWTAANFVVLSTLAYFITRMNRTPIAVTYRRWRIPSHDDGTVLRLAVVTYLVFHYVWHLFWYMLLLPGAYTGMWYAKMVGPLTLSHIEHLVLAAFSLLLITSFLSRIHGGDRYSHRVCTETSALLAFLMASHFGVP